MSVEIRPGVVTGKAYQTLVQAAKDGGYALPAVNVVGTNSVNAVLESAAKAKSDVIIQLSNGGAEFFAGKGYPDSAEAQHAAASIALPRHSAQNGASAALTSRFRGPPRGARCSPAPSASACARCTGTSPRRRPWGTSP